MKNNFKNNLKSLQFYTTSSISKKYTPYSLVSLIEFIQNIFNHYGYDFYEISKKDELTTITCKGYNLFLEDQIIPDEEGKNFPIDFSFKENDLKIWVKVDNYSDKFVATIMYPEEW